MIDFMLFLLCTFGISFYLCFKLPIPKEKVPGFFQRMFSCIFCTGFWAGLMGATLVFYPDIQPLKMLAFGFAGAAWSYIADTIMQKLEK